MGQSLPQFSDVSPAEVSHTELPQYGQSEELDGTSPNPQIPSPTTAQST
jgi:hypothetical protein